MEMPRVCHCAVVKIRRSIEIRQSFFESGRWGPCCHAAAEMQFYPVSTAVNNVRNEGAECVERVEAGRRELSGQMMLPFY